MICQVKAYEIQNYRKWTGGFYYKLKIVFANESLLFAREYYDYEQFERHYSFHWQNKGNHMIMRWDNSPHHRDVSTFPHHKHTNNGIAESVELSIREILEIIFKKLDNNANKKR